MGKEIKCPFCGNIEEEWYELDLKEDDINEIECGWCENIYKVKMRVTYEFKTEK